MNRKMINRWILYLAGMTILSFALTLNTKLTLGVSPIVSVSFGIASIWHLNFAVVNFWWSFIFIFAQIILRTGRKEYSLIPQVLLQIPANALSTILIDLFSGLLPVFAVDLAGTVWSSVGCRLVLLIIAMVLTGIGVALSLNTHLFPNPADGIVWVLSDCLGKNMGFAKNCLDISCVAITVTISLLMTGKIIGIGFGTVCTMFCIGRVMAVFNHYFKTRIASMTGLDL